MTENFKTALQIKFHQADPAGIMYFAHVFSLAHDCFEQFIQKVGYSWNEYFLDSPLAYPIRHCEADYKRPFLAGETYEVHVEVASLSTSSFQMRYIFKKNEDVHATVLIVHACMDPKTFKKAELPVELKEKFTPFMKEA